MTQTLDEFSALLLYSAMGVYAIAFIAFSLDLARRSAAVTAVAETGAERIARARAGGSAERGAAAGATGGSASDGNLAGYEYDNTKLATLPFRANLVAFAKNDYREYRTANGTGGWSDPTTAFGCFASSGTTRELTIPWSAVGGRPASFGILGYVTSSTGYAFAEAPNANPDGTIGLAATATKYFHVGSTGPASTTNAFADER